MYKMETVSALDETASPGVINGNMLMSLAIEQGPKGEAARLFLKDGIELNKLKEIRIEFLNILNIDFLWALKNLIKLSLSHNVIEIIENLDELVLLKELDLSFNRIKVIENLSHLNQLEILLLYSNEITVVEGIDNLKKLIILNIGKNKIADWEHAMYLREFKLLRSLNMCENPCAEMDGYLDYLFAFVPQLLYYQYVMITEDIRRFAVDKHLRVIRHLEEKEEKIQAELKVKQELEDKIALLSISYVEYLDEDSLFQYMFSLDKDGTTLSQINEEAQNAFEEYRISFSTICNELYEIGLEQHRIRMEEIQSHEIAINEGKESVRNEAREIVNQVLEEKTKIFEDIKNIMEALLENDESADDQAAKIRELFDKFNEMLSKARIQLMSKEVILHNQVEDINETFKYNITDMVRSFLDNARIYFSNLRNAESIYNDSINSTVLYYLSGLEDETLMPAHLVTVCGDKDILTTTLAASQDLHLQVIDNREDRLLDRLNDWIENYLNQLITDEKKRNHEQILEISHFFGTLQQEINMIGLPAPAHLKDIDLDMEDLTI